MKLLDRLTKKVVGQTSDAVKETVKKEARNILGDILPVLAGLGVVVGGVLIFHKPKAAEKAIDAVQKVAPTVSHTVTNNYFFSDSVKEELLDKLLK